MLQGLRTASNTWVGRTVLAVVMGFIIISFAIWGIGNIFQGFGQNHLGSVGGTEITISAFRSAYQAALQRIQARTGRALTNEEARLAGVDQQVLGQLISNAALDQEAHALGLSISDKQIAQSVLDDPRFKGANGQFSRERFLDALRDNGYSEQSFVLEQRSVYLRRQIEEAIAGGLTAPKAGVEALNRYRAEARTIDYLVLPAKSAGDIPAPSDDELKKFFADRKQVYRAPEYRKLIVLTLTPSMVAKPDAVSDADAMKLYDQVKAQRYETPEKRDIQQIVFPNEADAAAASARIKAGTSFAAIASERNLGAADIDLGTKTKPELAETAVADAAFSLPEGGVSEPIKSAFGTVLVRVAKIIPGTTKTYAEVAPDLKAEIAASRAQGDVTQLHDKIEDLRTSGKPLAEAAKAVGLEPRIVDAVDASGRDPSGQPVKDLVDPADLLKAAFASDIGVDNDTIETPDHGFTWFEVLKIDPSHDRAFDDVKAEVEKAWRSEEIDKRLATKAADLAKKVDGGETLQSIAAAEGVEVKTASGVRRGGAEGLSPGLVAQIFNTAPGGAGSAAGGDNTRILFKVTNSEVPALDMQDAQTKALADQYAQALSADIVAQYSARIQADLGVSINQRAVSLAVGGGGGDVE
jgi:peptidyl-prolyl cis-trans isomerase D